MKFIEKSSGWRGLWKGLIKTIVDRAFIIMMFIYSAIKKKAKGPAAYSTLNPDTSSDSPSVRSKGARFVSAKVEIYHIMARGQDVTRSHRGSWVVTRDWREKDPFIKRTERRIIAIVTS